MEVIYLKMELKSFQWANGYYVIMKETADEYHICKLVEGELETMAGGSYDIAVTGKGNKGIIRTNLTYNVKKD